MNHNLDQRFIEERRVAELRQMRHYRAARRQAAIEREQCRLQRWLAVYCGTCGVVLMLAVGGGCSVVLGVVLVAVGAVVWRTA
jgi:hypothetical protein